MKELKRLAAAAAAELKTGKLGDNYQMFANILNQHLIKGATNIDLATWRKVAESLGEDIGNDASFYWWLCGLAGEVSLLLVPTQHQISKMRLTVNVSELFDAIAKLEA